MGFKDKYVPYTQLTAWREAYRASGKTLVATNGCFDLLHLGHVTYLEAASELGDCLLVGVNGDQSVASLKGPSRPLNPEMDRALVLAALECVGAVTIFPETLATQFLEFAQPDVYVKGGDYSPETLNRSERETVEKGGGRIVIIPAVSGKSTSHLVNKMNQKPLLTSSESNL